jgi:hypothetical protein
LFEHLGPLGNLLTHTGGGPEAWWSATTLAEFLMWSVLLFAIAMFCPNSAQLLARHEPALGMRAPAAAGRGLFGLAWRPSIGWAIIVALLALASILRFSGPSEFLYWQF